MTELNLSTLVFFTPNLLYTAAACVTVRCFLKQFIFHILKVDILGVVKDNLRQLSKIVKDSYLR